jgi:ankyrin repeat protein
MRGAEKASAAGRENSSAVANPETASEPFKSEFDFAYVAESSSPQALLRFARLGLTERVLGMLDPVPGTNANDKVLKDVINKAILEACSAGKFELAGELLDRGGDVNARLPMDRGGRTLLHMAVVAERLPLLERLLANKDIEKDSVDAKGRSALHLATRFRKPNALKKLVASGVDLDMKTPEGHTALELCSNDALGGFTRDFFATDSIRAHLRDTKLLFWNSSARALEHYRKGE